MNSGRNVRIVNRLLITGSVGMSALGIFTKTQPEKKIYSAIAIGFLLAALIQMMLFKWKPEAFGDRPTDPK
jgi:hypothetical protein